MDWGLLGSDDGGKTVVVQPFGLGLECTIFRVHAVESSRVVRIETLQDNSGCPEVSTAMGVGSKPKRVRLQSPLNGRLIAGERKVQLPKGSQVDYHDQNSDVPVPGLVGLTLQQAREVVPAFRLRVVSKASSSEPDSIVTSQSPEAATKVRRHSDVTVDTRLR